MKNILLAFAAAILGLFGFGYLGYLFFELTWHPSFIAGPLELNSSQVLGRIVLCIGAASVVGLLICLWRHDVKQATENQNGEQA